MHISKIRRLICLGLLFSSFEVFAQSPWLNNNRPNFISFELSKPNFKSGNDGIGFFTGTYSLSGGFSVSEKSELVVDLPIAHYKATDGFFDPESTLGNIYVGLRTGDRSKVARGEFGVSLPTTSDDKLVANSIGFLSLLNREEKFAANTWGMTARVTAEKELNDNGAYYRLRGGLLYRKETESDTDLIHMDLQAQIGMRTSNGVGLWASLNGRVGLGDDSKYAEDDAASLLFALGISYRSKNFEPGLTMSLPLDDPYKQAVNHVIGFSLLFHLADKEE